MPTSIENERTFRKTMPGDGQQRCKNVEEDTLLFLYKSCSSLLLDPIIANGEKHEREEQDMKLRFSISKLFVTVAVIGIWLSTMRMSANSGLDIRSTLWLFILAIPAFSVIYHRGRRQAFWIGFVFVVLMKAIPNGWPLYAFRPKYRYTEPFQQWWVEFLSTNHFFVMDSVVLIGTLLFALLCGWLCVMVFDEAR